MNGWLEKNKDPLNDTVVDQFKHGTNELVKDIWIDHPGQTGAAAEAASGKGMRKFQMLLSFFTVKLIIIIFSIDS